MPPPARQRGREASSSRSPSGPSLAWPPHRPRRDADVADRLPPPGEAARGRGRRARPAGVRGAAQGVGRVGPRRPGRGRGGAARGRRRRAREPAPARAYAGLLEAYARRRRGDLDGARARIAALGYVGKWMLVGPVRQRRQGGARRTPYDPEKELELPLDLTRDYDGKDHKPVRWRHAAGGLAVRVDRLRRLRASRRADVQLRRRRSSRDRAREGARDARRARCGPARRGRCASSGTASRSCATTSTATSTADRFAATATLRAGWNRLTAKVCGDERAPMLSLRVADARRRARRDPRGGRRPAALDAGRAARWWPLGKGVVEQHAAASRGRRRPFEKLAKSERPGHARGVRALPRRDGRPTTRPSTARASSRARPPTRRRRWSGCCSRASSPRAATSAPTWIDEGRGDRGRAAGTTPASRPIDVAARARGLRARRA